MDCCRAAVAADQEDYLGTCLNSRFYFKLINWRRLHPVVDSRVEVSVFENTLSVCAATEISDSRRKQFRVGSIFEVDQSEIK